MLEGVMVFPKYSVAQSLAFSIPMMVTPRTDNGIPAVRGTNK